MGGAASWNATGTAHQDTRDAAGQDAGEAVQLQGTGHRTHYTSFLTAAGPETCERQKAVALLGQVCILLAFLLSIK